jgi:hypothetical protein
LYLCLYSESSVVIDRQKSLVLQMAGWDATYALCTTAKRTITTPSSKQATNQPTKQPSNQATKRVSKRVSKQPRK